MDLFSALLTFLAALVGKCNVLGLEWTYDGKDNWHQEFTPACNGTAQSPVNIDTSNVIVDEAALTPFVFTSYDKALDNTNIKNNGHTAQVNFKSPNNKPTISGGGLGNSYLFSQLHFHWGSKSSQGSEHTINNKMYPAEIHLVHYREDLGSLEKAANKVNGLAVLGAFFELCETDNQDIETLIGYLQKIPYKDDEFDVSGTLYLNKFLPEKTSLYYRYNGSLTTPFCFESVIWTVFEHKIKISERQLKAFRTLYELNKNQPNNLYMQDNFRNVQPLHSRDIRASSPQTSSGYRPNSETKFMVVILVCIILTKLWC